MTDVVFWGATGQCRVLREAIQGQGHRLCAIFDNREVASPFADVPIEVGAAGFSRWASAQTDLSQIRACVAIGGARGDERLTIQEWLADQGLAPISIIHRTAFVADDCLIGTGSQILAMSAICTNTQIGRAVIVNTSSSIDHDCRIGDSCHVGPGARLAGEVVLGRNVFVGMGAVILPRIRVGNDVIVGAGAVVTKDVEAGAVVIGTPARPIRRTT